MDEIVRVVSFLGEHLLFYCIKLRRQTSRLYGWLKARLGAGVGVEDEDDHDIGFDDDGCNVDNRVERLQYGHGPNVDDVASRMKMRVRDMPALSSTMAINMRCV